MKGLAEIKRFEREALADYIRKLYAEIPKEPMGGYEFELERAIRFDIERAEKEYEQL